MKKLLGTALILSMLGGSAAVAAPYGTINRGHQAQDNSGAIVAGIGLLVLGAFLASQNNRQDYGYQRSYQSRGWDQDWNNGWNRNRGWSQNQYNGWDDRGGYNRGR